MTECPVEIIQYIKELDYDIALAAARGAQTIALHAPPIIVKIGERTEQGIMFLPQFFFQTFNFAR